MGALSDYAGPEADAKAHPYFAFFWRCILSEVVAPAYAWVSYRKNLLGHLLQDVMGVREDVEQQTNGNVSDFKIIQDEFPELYKVTTTKFRTIVRLHTSCGSKGIPMNMFEA